MVKKHGRRGRWDFRFFCFGYPLEWFSGFCAKKRRFFDFGLHWGYGFSVSSHLDVKKTSRFSDLVSDVDFGLFYFGPVFSSISAPALIMILNSRETQKLYQLASSVQSHVRPNYWSNVTD